MNFSIDRFEEDYAVCQDDGEKMHNIKISELPSGIRPGDIITKLPNGKFVYNAEETLKRKNKIKKLQDRLFKNSK